MRLTIDIGATYLALPLVRESERRELERGEHVMLLDIEGEDIRAMEVVEVCRDTRGDPPPDPEHYPRWYVVDRGVCGTVARSWPKGTMVQGVKVSSLPDGGFRFHPLAL